MKRVLCFDASTTTIGISVLDYNDVDIKLIYSDFFKPPKKGNIFERLVTVRAFINAKIEEYNPNFTTIEDIVLFMKGKSTATTITSLAVLNRTIGLTIFDKTDKPPYLYNAMRIRHAIKIDGKLPSKEQIPDVVATILGIKFPYKYKKNKDGSSSIIEENYDIADSIACGICHIYMDRAGKSEMLQIKKKKRRRKKKNG